MYACLVSKVYKTLNKTFFKLSLIKLIIKLFIHNYFTRANFCLIRSTLRILNSRTNVF